MTSHDVPPDAVRRTGRRGQAGLGAVVLVLLAGCGAGSAASPGATGPSPASSSASSASGAPGTRVSPRPGPSPTPWRPSGHQSFTRLHSDVGRLLETSLAGRRSGVRMRVWVWLPPQYDQPASARKAFPALMLYPGGSGAGYNTWVGRQYGGREVVARHGTPFVFVMPEMQLSERRDTECADLPGQPKVGTFLAVDVRQMVETNFRVQRDRRGWGAVGASSGAYCASRLVFNHPDQYAAVVSIGGYFSIQTPLSGARSPAVLAQDPAVIAAKNPPDVDMLLWAGGRNRTDLRDAKHFLGLVKPPTTAKLQVLSGGRHLTADFARMMPGTFAFLSARLNAPTPIG